MSLPPKYFFPSHIPTRLLIFVPPYLIHIILSIYLITPSVNIVRGGIQAANKWRCMSITAVNISLDMLWSLCSTYTYFYKLEQGFKLP
jgi:hypothetical protein